MSGEKNNEETGSDFITSKLLKSRSVVISQQVDSKLSEKILNQIVLLEQEGSFLFEQGDFVVRTVFNSKKLVSSLYAAAV